ncbi:DUF3558 family protein [Nocardia sp. BSTN01]|uniref:DUF3558 family protein n=1 Tax=Nocardia sp. BSTN01 TaxID=2783665 RepID=UPI00188EB983|nr:DUF3558 family protein [Nocardia sp. BSTN01]MBF5001793.1 DUF3558 family protein [Nocardia sp. BSTN01]
MRARLIGLAIAVVALGAVSGCSAAASKPTGMFDPCKEIPDTAIRSAGFDPRTKELAETLTGDSVKCKFTSAGGTGVLYLEHPNALAPMRSYESSLASAQSVGESPGGQAPVVTKINGRDAYLGPQILLGCAVNLRTATGVLTVQVDYSDHNDCPSAQEAAAALEPSIGSR